jgi:hypothetical protein
LGIIGTGLLAIPILAASAPMPSARRSGGPRSLAPPKQGRSPASWESSRLPAGYDGWAGLSRWLSASSEW